MNLLECLCILFGISYFWFAFFIIGKDNPLVKPDVTAIAICAIILTITAYIPIRLLTILIG